MKKILSLAVLLAVMLSLGIFSVAAEKEYTVEDLSFTVPDFLVNDAQWAESSGFDFAFSDTDVNMELNISVYENEGYSYSGLDEEALEEYGSLISEKYNTGDYSPLESVTVTNYSLENGTDGIRIDILFAEEQYVFYWFATESTCYDLNFYIYGSDYLTYVDQVIKTVNIGAVIPEADLEVPNTEDNTGEGDGNVPELSDDIVASDADSEVGKESDNKIYLVIAVAAIVLAIVISVVIVIRKKQSKKAVETYLSDQNNDSGVYYDPNTGAYYKKPSAQEAQQPAGQPIGYIYYPISDNSGQINNETNNNP